MSRTACRRSRPPPPDSRPASPSPNEIPSASNACCICSGVNASPNGRPSACNSDRRTSPNALSTPPHARVKDMRPSLVQPDRTVQGRSHRRRTIGQVGLTTKPNVSLRPQTLDDDRPQHMLSRVRPTVVRPATSNARTAVPFGSGATLFGTRVAGGGGFHLCAARFAQHRA